MKKTHSFDFFSVNYRLISALVSTNIIDRLTKLKINYIFVYEQSINILCKKARKCHNIIINSNGKRSERTLNSSSHRKEGKVKKSLRLIAHKDVIELSLLFINHKRDMCIHMCFLLQSFSTSQHSQKI